MTWWPARFPPGVDRRDPHRWTSGWPAGYLGQARAVGRAVRCPAPRGFPRPPGPPASSLYRSGDLGRWTPGGRAGPAGVPRAGRRPGQDPGSPDRARRDRCRPHRTARGSSRPRPPWWSTGRHRRRGPCPAGRPGHSTPAPTWSSTVCAAACRRTTRARPDRRSRRSARCAGTTRPTGTGWRSTSVTPGRAGRRSTERIRARTGRRCRLRLPGPALGGQGQHLHAVPGGRPRTDDRLSSPSTTATSRHRRWPTAGGSATTSGSSSTSPTTEHMNGRSSATASSGSPTSATAASRRSTPSA